MSKRLKPADRKQEILDAALRVASTPGGWGQLTRANVSVDADCAEGLVSRYFGTMAAFKRAIMRAAIASKNLSVVAQGLAAGDPNAQKAPPELKVLALATLAN